MAGTCIHGLDSGACLICRTLQIPAEPGRPEVVYSSPTARRRRGGSVAVVAVSVAAVALAAWVLLGAVYTAFRLLELVIVAAGAGWSGYKVGHFLGERDARHRR